MLTLIIGTNRPGSNTAKIAREVISAYGTLGEELQIVNLADLPPEIFSPSSYAEKPAVFRPFVDKILGSEGLIVVTPEYNGGIPGVLKYFIDMLPFPESFEARPVCFVGLAAGQWGALRPVEQLQAIFGYRNAYIYPVRVFVPGVEAVVDEAGQLTDGALRKRLAKQAAGFAAFARTIRSGKS
ncbi:MAG TPA: NAD(P)H-dependent oxidoreductase [Opitutaceae bacterium]